MRTFLPSILMTLLCFSLALLYGVQTEKSLLSVMGLMAVLCILEISLSFDNAVVNAAVLDDMDERWQKYFLTWGILIAVFGMRLVFPILIVAVTGMLGPIEVLKLALDDPEQYATILSASHIEVSAFGGTFLLLVFLTFLLNDEKTIHWLEVVEKQLADIGKLESVEIVIALAALMLVQLMIPEDARLGVLVYGIAGIILFVLVDSLSQLIAPESPGDVARNGAIGFLYLEILDASFSFDGVLGAFAITSDIVIIMLGLAIGAMFVRNLTVYLVKQGTLDEYRFLEHGAHYAIGALATIMLIRIVIHVPEIITGLAGIVIIALSLYSSFRYRSREPA